MDLDGDGRTDVLSGSWPGEIYLFRGKADRSFSAGEQLRGKNGRPLQPGQATAAFAFDWDGDGRLDLIVGTVDGSMVFLKNVSSDRDLVFDDAKPILAGGKPIEVPGDAAPVVGDWDGDGLPDLVVGAEDGSIVWFRNTGSRAAPDLAAAKVLVPRRPAAGRGDPLPGEWGRRVKPCLFDWDGDGKLDLLVGDVNASYSGKPTLTPEERADEAQAKTRLPQLRKEWAAAYRAFSAAENEVSPPDRDKHARKVKNLRASVARLKDEIAQSQEAEGKYAGGYMSHGYVWAFYRK